MTKPVATLCVVVVLACLLVHLEADEIDVPPESQQNLLYGSTAVLRCADESFNPSHFTSARFQWILPSTSIINESSPFDSRHYSFHDNGSTLVVNAIDKPDFGWYHCLVLTDPFSVHATVRLGVNVNGPYFGDLLEKYSSNMKTGLAAGGVVFIVMAMFCFNYDQFQARHDRPRAATLTSPTKRDPSSQEMCCINNGFVNDAATADMSAGDTSVHISVVGVEVNEDKTSF